MDSVERSAGLSTELLRLLVDQVEDYAIFVLTPTGHVASWNTGAQRIKGYKAGEIIGSHFSRFYRREEIEAGKCEMELSEASRVGRFEDEGWRLRADGSTFWANVVITALRDEAGRLVGFAKVTRDLTARRAAEQDARRLAEAHATQRAAETLQTVGIAFAGALTRADVVRVVASQVLAALEADGGSLATCVPGKDAIVFEWDLGAQSDHSLIEAAIRTRTPVFVDVPHAVAAALPLLVRDECIGAYAVTRSAARPFTAPERAMAQAIAHHLALALDRASVFQREADAVRVRDDFMSIAGHELRTPLAALSLTLQTLDRMLAKGAEQGEQDPALRERLGKAMRNAERLARLISELLDVARMRSNRLELDLEELDLAWLVQQSIGGLAELASRMATDVQVELESPVVGRFDRFRVEQVITNLVTNAIKYGLGKPVVVQLRREGDVAVLGVRDRGIGIDPSHQRRIFERFERAVSGRNYGGLGLGLWISRQIVDASGGSIDVQSVPGEGSHFVVRLPLGERRTEP